MASEDLPDPETPLMATKEFSGMSMFRFFRLLALAPRTSMLSGMQFLCLICMSHLLSFVWFYFNTVFLMEMVVDCFVGGLLPTPR